MTSLNVIFFLLPLLIFTLTPSVFAETIVTEHNFNTDNGDGTGTLRTHHPYVFDGDNWVPFIASGTQVQTHMGSVTLNGTGYFQWNGKFNDSITAKYADISDLNTWTYPNTLNNDVPDISWDGSQLVSEKNKSGVGNLKYKYVFDNGKWKTQLEATNLSALTTKVFGFDQTINLNSDTIKFGGITRNLDNFDGQTFDKEFLIANEGKVLDLLNGINFDFDLGFENLYSITVYDTGANKSRLVFDYRTNEVLLPGETLIIDPTFNSGASTNDGRIFSTAVTGAACSATYSGITTTNNLNVKRDSGSNDDCSATYFNFDISSAGVITEVTSATIEFDIVTSSNPLNCDFIHKATDFTGAQESWTALLSYTGATVVKNNSATCASGVADGYVVTFDSNIYPLIVADSTGDQTVSIGVGYDNWARDATLHRFDFRNNDAVLEFVYDMIPIPDAVDDLVSPSQSFGSVDLLWTEPELYGETCEGYQINYTTPHGNPLTVITNNTGTCTTSSTVSGLSISTDYTFGVSVWTAGGNNATNPPMVWLNTTTAGNFTIGSAVFNQTNTEILPITFEEQLINSTATFLNVTYANTYTLACDFYYQFANTNNTYTGLTGYAVSSTLDETYFILTDFENEIINVNCYDTVTGTDANYLMTQTDFPLLQQFANFRNGTYGTMGMFGAFDFITIAVVIFSMIGLNRVNESVGAIFNIILLGVLSYFEIIELPTIIFGVLTVVIIFVITSTRKD